MNGPLQRFAKYTHGGFTIMELILAIGMLAVIAFIIIAAINPTNQLQATRTSKSAVLSRELENAIIQYLIDGSSFAGIPTGRDNAEDVCLSSVTGAACTTAGGLDLSALVPTYLTDIPTDPDTATATLSGYRVYLDGSFIKICSSNTAGCGP